MPNGNVANRIPKSLREAQAENIGVGKIVNQNGTGHLVFL